MKYDKVIKLGNIIPNGQKYYDRRNVIIWPRGCANTLDTSPMSNLIMVWKRPTKES